MFSNPEIVHTYTRKQAIEDGVLIDVRPELKRMEMQLAGWSTICFTMQLFATLIDSSERPDFALKACWENFIQAIFDNFRSRQPQYWSFMFSCYHTTLRYDVKIMAVIHRDDEGQEVVTLMQEGED